VQISEFPGQDFTGIVARNAGALDPTARTLSTEIHIDNRNGKLMAGLYAEVIFSLIPDQPYFIIPTRALVIRNGPPQVAVLDGEDKVTLVDVSLGRNWGKNIEVVSGLKENDRIVINPSPRVVTGAKVSFDKK
jgi:multidrug efflux pump subunit AcrA (membrane-fusion protein)